VHESVGVPVHESPSGVLAPEHQGHPQRPVLIRQTSDRTVLPLYPHQLERRHRPGRAGRKAGGAARRARWTPL